MPDVPLLLAIAAATLIGYLLGRIRPAHRASDWANWRRHGQRPAGLRYAAVWTVLSAENIAWLVTHPVKGCHAWRHRNDPPPPRSPALTFRRMAADLGVDTPEYGQTSDQPSPYLKPTPGAPDA